MATINKLDKNKWEVRYDSYDTQGKRHQRRKTFPRAADAKAFAASLDSSSPYEASFVTFSDFADKWFALQQGKLEAESIRIYAYALGNCKAHLGSVRLNALTPSKIEAFFGALTESGLSASTLRVHRAVLARIFKYAIRDGYIATSPLDRVEPPRRIRRELVLPDLEALKRRLQELKGTSCYLPAMLALMTGMRRGEIAGLCWDCVDLDNALIHVRRVRICTAKGTHGPNDIPLNIRGLTRNISREYTKTKQQRTITIPPSLVTLLRTQRIAQAEARLRLGASYVDSDYVCTRPDGVPIAVGTLTGSLGKLCRFHDLRHFNASLLLDEGYSVAAVADRIGHASPQTTLNVYAHIINNPDRKAADSIERRLQIKI